jgi:large subunit ribosomal protein L30
MDNIIIMGKIRVVQFKSSIGASKAQKKILKALGIGKLNRPVEHESRPEILGMVNKLKHLVRIEEIDE